MLRWTHLSPFPRAIFAQLTTESPYALEWATYAPLKIVHSVVRIWASIKHLVPWAHPSPIPKRHVDSFSCFCRAHDCDRQTNRQTDYATPSVTIGCTYVVLRCGLIITITGVLVFFFREKVCIVILVGPNVLQAL